MMKNKIINRREALERSSWVLKSALFAPTVLSVLQGCTPKEINTRNLLVFTDGQDSLVKIIANTIIPKTHTPGASEVKVNQFLDLLLNDVFEKEFRKQFLNGLKQFDKDCLTKTGKSYTSLSEKERFNYLEALDRQVMGKEYEETVPFYFTFKHLISLIYFSTEEGVKQNLNYLPIPGSYRGNIEYKDGDKIMVGNYM